MEMFEDDTEKEIGGSRKLCNKLHNLYLSLG
jgi:hypothetical protein